MSKPSKPCRDVSIVAYPCPSKKGFDSLRGGHIMQRVMRVFSILFALLLLFNCDHKASPELEKKLGPEGVKRLGLEPAEKPHASILPSLDNTIKKTEEKKPSAASALLKLAEIALEPTPEQKQRETLVERCNIAAAKSHAALAAGNREVFVSWLAGDILEKYSDVQEFERLRTEIKKFDDRKCIPTTSEMRGVRLAQGSLKFFIDYHFENPEGEKFSFRVIFAAPANTDGAPVQKLDEALLAVHGEEIRIESFRPSAPDAPLNAVEQVLVDAMAPAAR